MRCGKAEELEVDDVKLGRNPHECAVAKTAPFYCLYVSTGSQPARMRCGKADYINLWSIDCGVATRTNALWQSHVGYVVGQNASVATRTNALWQRQRISLIALSLLRRNPHECAVAKPLCNCYDNFATESQPARMRCGKDCWKIISVSPFASQPARMRCGKVFRNV